MNKFLKAFFALDLWIALSLITTIITNIFFSSNEVLMLSLSIVFALVNAVFSIITIKSINFYKTRNMKEIINK